MKPKDFVISDFPEIFEVIKNALRQGFLKMPFDQKLAEKVFLINNIPQFIKLRNETYSKYDLLNSDALNIKISEDFPSDYDQADLSNRLGAFLVADSKRRAFDEVNRRPGNIIETAESDLRNLLGENYKQEDIETVLSLAPHITYEFYRTRIIIKTKLNSERDIESDRTKDVIEKMFLGKKEYFLRFKRQVNKIPVERFRMMEEQNKRIGERKTDLIKELDDTTRKAVEDLTNLKKIVFFDDPARHFEVDWMGDYFIRKACAVRLNDRGIISSPNPFNIPQTKLYNLIRENNIEVIQNEND